MKQRSSVIAVGVGAGCSRSIGLHGLWLVLLACGRTSPMDAPEPEVDDAALVTDTGAPVVVPEASTPLPTDAGTPVDAAATFDATPLDAASSLDATPAADAQPTLDAPASDAAEAAAEDAAAADFRGTSRCADAGLKFCDDFEESAIDMRNWQRVGTSSTEPALERSGDPGRGLQSLHVHTSRGNASGLVHRASFPFARETYWGRMLLKIAQLPTSPRGAHWTILGADPQGDLFSSPEHRFGGQWYDQNYWGVGSDHGASGDWTNLDRTTPVKLGTWHCFEWMVDATNDVSKLFRDGKEITALGTTREVKHAEGNTSVPYDIPPIRQTWVGFWFYQGGQGTAQDYDVWIDSFALDEARIGCAR